jgi:hypothetical protein
MAGNQVENGFEGHRSDSDQQNEQEFENAQQMRPLNEGRQGIGPEIPHVANQIVS